MKRNSNTQAQGEPSLFDGLNPQEPAERVEVGTGPTAQDGEPYTTPATAEEWADMMLYYEDTKRTYERAGLWGVWTSETLLRRAEVYYNQRVTTVVKTMTAAGAPVDVVNAVCSDYIGILSGSCKFVATVEQIQTALKTLQPSAAFSIDRYGLYFGLFLNYSRFLLVYKDYDFTVKGLHATDDTKRVYLSEFYPPMDARAVRWLLDKGYFQASDFSGFEPSEMGEYFARISAFAELGEYVLYYTVARLALLATPDELAEVEPPPHAQGQTDIIAFCENVVKDTVDKLNEAAEKFDALTSDAPTEQAQAQKAARDWRDDTNARPIKIHENYGLVLSRPVNVSPNGATITKRLSIQQYIDRFTTANPQFGDITQMTVQKVFEGVNLLPQYLADKMQIGPNGQYIYRTNISEFAEFCGYVDASQPQKMALLGALLISSNIYFILEKPIRYEEFTNVKGHVVRQKTGGVVAMQFVNVPEIGRDTGNLIIEVRPESLKGHPTFITADIYKKLRDTSKGLTQSRFNAQITSKSHKSENDLIDEVFGFADMREHATPSTLPKVNTYIRKNRPNARNKMLRWFDDYVKAGILTHYKRVPSKTNKGDFVLSWDCVKPDKLKPIEPFLQAPDEQ